MSEGPAAELIIEGRVATLAGDRGFGWRGALAVGEGRVLAAGSTSEVRALAGLDTVRWRLGRDLMVVPGITDAHLHLMLLVLAESQLDLTPTPDLEGTLAAVARAQAARLAQGDGDGWLLGHGWSLDGLGRWPDAEMLERACPGRPVALYAHDHHSRWLSETALRAAGIDRGTADPLGGMIRRDQEGRPTGILHETATGLVDQAVPDPPAVELERGLVREAAALAALGVTGCHDPGELSSETRIVRGPAFYGQIAAAGRLPLRVHASIREPQLAAAIALGLKSGDGVAPAGADPAARLAAERYRMGWLKLFADGSLGSRSAALLEPYSDASQRSPTGGPRGMFLATREELRDALDRAAAAGIDSQVHAIGDAAVRLALDLLSTLPPGRLMRRVEHAQLVHPDDQRRFAALGIAASVQPVHLRSDAAAVHEAWGERGEHSFPLAALASSGAVTPFGTDAPVEPADPWPGLAVAVARRDPFDAAAVPLAGRQGIDVARALRAACLDPAIAAGQADLGRLIAGQRADLLVVPAIGFDEPSDAAALASTRPLATLLDGRVVYRSPEFDA